MKALDHFCTTILKKILSLLVLLSYIKIHKNIIISRIIKNSKNIYRIYLIKSCVKRKDNVGDSGGKENANDKYRTATDGRERMAS